ncbi:MAG: hypothetical protein M3458_19635 [Acidobacteriota bacterium]|nr:hypothetical protein [Acidobacteriota bacterium]MDQ3652440.1 hypothetical protein [Acidobacteriota bacterium]
MSLKLYCNRYAHFKDALVCSVNCIYRTRCRDFALFYDEHRAGVDASVADYYTARRTSLDDSVSPAPRRALPVVPAVATPTDMRELIRLEVKREMVEAVYIWVDKEDRAELIATEEVLRRAERGAKAKHIYKVAQEMELRFQLVPRKRIEKVKRTVADEAERAQARRNRATAKAPALSLAASPPDGVVDKAPAAAAPVTRRTRSRIAKAAGQR